MIYVLPTYTVEHFEGINESPIPAAAHKALAELSAEGRNHNCTSLHWEQNAFAAIAGDQVIGLIVYEDAKWRNELAIIVGWVEESHRGRGIYRDLWLRLVAKAQELGRRNIGGGTHVDNHRMQTVMEAFGRRPTFIHYAFPVPAKTEAPAEGE